MLTRLSIRNFKGLADADIELGSTVVLIGPNNSGKTSALQALALWQSGLDHWLARRSDSGTQERTGVTLSRAALTHTPVLDTRSLWRNLRVQHGTAAGGRNDKIFVEITVHGQNGAGSALNTWSCGLQFYFANTESIYCRPILPANVEPSDRIPDMMEAAKHRVALLPAMSGLMAEEPELQAGRIGVLVGEGQTAQVLRNLCLAVSTRDDGGWAAIKDDIRRMFGVALRDPERILARGSIRLVYEDRQRNVLDIASAGRGLQQVLLLLAHIRGNPGAVLLLDEPDAHLEIIRQREIYTVLTDAATTASSQVIAASHSEVILNEASQRDVVIAFVGTPHRLNNRPSQVLKSLRDIGFDQYYLAEARKAVLYLEGATDLRILQAFAARLEHRAASGLRDAFVKYVGNQPTAASDHFYGLREAVPDLRCFALFDRLERALPAGFQLAHHVWTRREIENYFCRKDVLVRFAMPQPDADLFSAPQVEAMQRAIAEVEAASRVFRRDPWGVDVKASEDVLPPIFDRYYSALGGRNEMDKADFHELVSFMEPSDIDPEVSAVLDRVAELLAVDAAA